ncbi:MAG: PAS domain S-box protein [Leptolyngbyaceae bacterium]|nr:PAS domain S-box protein [Leptolyngbyaceae bacterium]
MPQSHSQPIGEQLLDTETRNDIPTRNDVPAVHEVLERANADLEQKVSERTRELTATIARLTQELKEAKHNEAVHKQAEVALRQSEATYRALITAIPDLLIRVKGDGTYLDIIGQHRFNIQNSDLFVPGTHVRDSLVPSQAEKRMQYIQKALETGSMQRYEQQFTNNGQTHYEEVRVLVCGEDEVLLISREITDLKLAEAALRHSEARNQALIKAIPDLMIRMSREGTYLDFISAKSKLKQIGGIEMLGKNIYDILPVEMAQQRMAYAEKALQTGETQLYECQIAVDGEIWMEETRIAVCGEDEVLVIVRDISERKRAEAERQRMETERKQADRQRHTRYAVTQILAEAHSLESSISQVLQVICENLDWSLGEFWSFDEQSQTLQRQVYWHGRSPEVAAFSLATQPICLPGQGLSGRVFVSSHPIWVADLWNDSNFLRVETAQKAGLRSGFGFSITSKGKVAGVITFFGCEVRPLDEALLTVMVSIGSQMNQFIEQRQGEEALRQSEQRFRDVSEAAGEYLWEIDHQGLYTFLTDKVKSVKGFDATALLGRSPFEFMHPEDIINVQTILQEASDRKGNFTLEHRNITPSGEIVWEKVNGLPLLDAQGEIMGFRGAGLSITEQKLAEAALKASEQQIKQKAQDLEQTLKELQSTQSQLIQSEKMSSLGQLVAGVAHEINNPVNFIYGNLIHANEYTQDLLNLIALYQHYYPTPVPAIQEEVEAIDLDFLVQDLPQLLSSMKSGADRIRHIVASLRNFSRMDEAEFKTVDLHEGIDSTLMILQHRFKATASHAGIQVIKEYGELPQVECYAGQLNQVFMNILSNALDSLEERDTQRSADAIQQAPSTIHISTRMLGDHQVAIQFTDNGTGIPESVQNRLFDPFFTTKPVGKGTGMGLSISYQIVTEKHHGSLECVSTPGEGATFVIIIPVRQ